MTTIPQIDVDFAIPTAVVEAGMPQADVAIPGIPGPPGTTKQTINFGALGPFSGSQQGRVPFYPRINGVITRVTAAVDAQTSGATRPDVNIDGVSIYTDQTQRPNLNGTGRHFDDGGTIGAGAFTATQPITVDRDSSGVGSEGLIVTVEYEPN